MALVRTIFLIPIFFILGVFLGATEYTNSFNDIKWTDIASVLMTFFGLFFGFYTYAKWLNTKKQEDSYNIAKKYLFSMDEIREILREALFQYNHICPAPGLLVEPVDVSKQRIEHLYKLSELLYRAKVSLINNKHELEFWRISLTQDFNSKHDDFLKNIDNIGVVIRCLNSQLYAFIVHNQSNTNEIIKQKNVFDKHFAMTEKVVVERINLGFDKIFQFK